MIHAAMKDLKILYFKRLYLDYSDLAIQNKDKLIIEPSHMQSP